MSAFKPQSIKWPADRAVLLVHGIGDASGAGAAAFPTAQLAAALGDDAANVAVYTLNYDFINDWAVRKTNLAAGIEVLGKAVATHFANAELSTTLAKYCGDVLWPILHLDTRMAVRDAYIAQLQQIVLDCGEAALARGHDPLEYRVSIVAHSLGCFHTYEALHAAVREPEYRLQPGTDLTQLECVVLMASPVQLIRSVAGDIGVLVPDRNGLSTMDAAGLSLPSQKMGRKSVPAARHFVSVTGSQDPVGGHLFGKQQTWGFMSIAGQRTQIVTQSLVGGDTAQALTLALAAGDGAGAALGSVIINPHSWTAYVSTEASLLREVLA